MTQHNLFVLARVNEEQDGQDEAFDILLSVMQSEHTKQVDPGNPHGPIGPSSERLVELVPSSSPHGVQLASREKRELVSGVVEVLKQARGLIVPLRAIVVEEGTGQKCVSQSGLDERIWSWNASREIDDNVLYLL